MCNGSIGISENKLILSGDFTKETVSPLFPEIKKESLSGIDCLDFGSAEIIDSAGVALLDYILHDLCKNSTFIIEGIDDKKIKTINTFSRYYELDQTKKDRLLKSKEVMTEVSVLPGKKTIFEATGDKFFYLKDKMTELLVLSSDIFFWSVVGLFERKASRKGSFLQQSILIGLEAVPVITFLSLIIGLILALQSAAQLRQFGANIFVADLISIAMVREMGPLMTAIIVAGRSGSAIASEIATMKVTEELDALKMMAISPVRYVIVPKIHAITVCMPLLVTISIIIGIFGGLIIAVTYLGLSPVSFYTQSLNVLVLKDIIVSYIKSLFFAWTIVVIGSYYGLQVKGGAEGVGRATTLSVVASIFAVIFLDVIFSLLFLPK